MYYSFPSLKSKVGGPEEKLIIDMTRYCQGPSLGFCLKQLIIDTSKGQQTDRYFQFPFIDEHPWICISHITVNHNSAFANLMAAQCFGLQFPSVVLAGTDGNCSPEDLKVGEGCQVWGK